MHRPTDLRINLEGRNLAKRYRGRTIFSGIDIHASQSEIIGIIGRNGSGKTTLLKILAGILSPNDGSVRFSIDNREVASDAFSTHLGLVAPYLILYEEFSALEHLQLTASLRGLSHSAEQSAALLDRLGLYAQRFDRIDTFSSGMKQRLKIATAVQHEPELLFLDEPMTNLDTHGVDTVTALITEHRANGGAVLLATNDDRDRRLCTHTVSVESPQ